MKKTLLQVAVAATLLGAGASAALAHGYDDAYYAHRHPAWEHQRDLQRYPAPAYGYPAQPYYAGPAYAYPAPAYQAGYVDGASPRAVGQVGGAVVGALVGSNVAHGRNRVAGAAIGAALGALIGGELASNR